MASFSTPRQVTFKSGGVIAKYSLVKLSDKETIVACSADDIAVGIAYADASAAGELVPVMLQGGGGKVMLGGTVAVGDWLKPDASAMGVVASATEKASCMAVQAGVAGDIVAVEVEHITV